MFKEAIKKSLQYTRPLITGHLYYKNKKIINGISTLIVLNDEGDILTSSHVADLFLMADETNEVYIPILKELKSSSSKEIKKIETKYGIKDNTLVGLYNMLIDISNNPGKLTIIKHEYLDLAIIKLEHKNDILVKNFPIFKRSVIDIGESVCKVGFAFPEYHAFDYDDEDCKIKAINKLMNFPIFPLDGMITRNMTDINNNVTEFEISTPVLPGQSGGPILDTNGLIVGIQLGTKRIVNNADKNMQFTIDLGIGINSITIMNFLDNNNIEYNYK